MATTLTELLGGQLIQHNDSTNESNQISTKELDGKTIALYFSAPSCGPCRRFTPKLTKCYKEVQNEFKDKFDIVFISRDEDQASLNEYFKEMPWKALPFLDRDRVKELAEKYNVRGIPTLVVLSPTCEIINEDGVDEMRTAPKEALHQWIQGKRLFWSRQAKEDEHTWEGVSCIQCYMSPLIGTRYGCTYPDCNTNVCETCLPKAQHEHSLVEYLQPKKHYSLEQLFKTVPHLLSPNNDDKIETKTIWENNVKTIGFYFSSDQHPSCLEFTPKLAEMYKEAQSNSSGFRLVFISCDDDETSFDEYRATMPWPAIPFNASGVIKEYFHYYGIPTVFVVGSDGKILTRHGHDTIERKGVDALKTWAQGEKVPPPTEDEFAWSGITCDGCKMLPLIGQRYYCSTCDNYNLCSACEKKGHEHSLQLVPQLSEDEDD